MPSDSDGARRTVLVAVIVYNGRPFVPACLESVVAMRDASRNDVRVVVLDDCSPEPGWSEDLEELCSGLGIAYYRSPRNLGIPRNMNLGLRYGLAIDADHVVLLNSDVIVAENLVDVMVATAEGDPSIASVTAWSNNVSIFSLPNAEPERFLSERPAVNMVSDALEQEFRDTGVDIPVGVGFCMLLPAGAIDHVGLLDPIYGRGYCEEVDWCRRAVGLGYRHVLSPGAFAFHIGNASAKDAGLLAEGASTVWEHEAIVDLRFPDYRSALERYAASDPMPEIRRRALLAILRRAALLHGYTVEASWLHRQSTSGDVRFIVEPDGPLGLVTARYNGFEVGLPYEGGNILKAVTEFVGEPPRQITAFDRGRLADVITEQAAAAGLKIHRPTGYPERITGP